MVTLVAGAVAVGIASICAIPFGCFISRKMKRKKVRNPPEVTNEPEFEDESQPNLALVINPVELSDEPRYQIEETWSRADNRRSRRLEIRVLVSSGSTRSIEVPSQGYITASGASETPSSRGGARARIMEVGRSSLPHLAVGPATNCQNRAGSSSLPITGRIPGAENQELQNSDTTRFEITISGPFSKSGAQFGDFKDEVPDSSTPKSKANSTEVSGNREPNIHKSRFWKRATSSSNENGKPKIVKTTRDLEVVDVESVPGDDLRKRRNFEPQESSCTDTEEERNCGRNKCRKPRGEAAGSSKENGAASDRGRWGLPGRFFDTFRETTNFATL